MKWLKYDVGAPIQKSRYLSLLFSPALIAPRIQDDASVDKNIKISKNQRMAQK